MAEKMVMTNVLKVWLNIFWKVLTAHYKDIPKSGAEAKTRKLLIPYSEKNVVEVDGQKYVQWDYRNGPAIIQWDEEIESTLSDEEKEKIRNESV